LTEYLEVLFGTCFISNTMQPLHTLLCLQTTLNNKQLTINYESNIKTPVSASGKRVLYGQMSQIA